MIFQVGAHPDPWGLIKYHLFFVLRLERAWAESYESNSGVPLQCTKRARERLFPGLLFGGALAIVTFCEKVQERAVCIVFNINFFFSA